MAVQCRLLTTQIGPPMAAKVFISYRREDSAAYAGRIRDRLEHEFGRGPLFIDVDDIPLGINFVKVLREEIAKCGVLLAVIGPRWLDARDEDGTRRLDNPNDFVRIEIAVALQREIPVIPILLDGTKIPKTGQLPKDLEELALRNRLNVRHDSFHTDMDKLIQELRGQVGVETIPEPKDSDHGIRIVLGKDAPYETYRQHLYHQTHLIKIRVVNKFARKKLTNCEIVLDQITGALSSRCPVPIKTGFTLNPGGSTYIEFVELREPRSGPPFSAPGAGIKAYFPINPLPSDKSSWLDDPPYTLTLIATAAESAMHRLQCRPLLDDGKVKLE